MIYISCFRRQQPLKTEAIIQDTTGEVDENLGPIEPSYPSPKFQRNITFSLLHVRIYTTMTIISNN